MEISNPQLAPGVHFYRRGDSKLQIGINPNSSLIIEPIIGSALAKLLNGNNSLSSICEALAESGIDKKSSQNFMSQMINLGLVIPGPTTQTHDDKNPVTSIQRRNLFRETHGDLTAIKNRIECEISITGAGRLGTTLCLLLASSGFPNITIHDAGLVREGDLTPWGATRIDIGLKRDQVARLLVERITRGASAHQNSFRFRAMRKLEILLPDQRADFPWIEATSADLMTAKDVPYLFAATSASSSLISSVITPGTDPCLRCQHLHRCDQDPDWPLIDLQVAQQAQLDTAPISLIMRTALEIQRSIECWIDLPQRATPSVKRLSATSPDETYPTHFHPSCGCRWDLTG
jgi:hypothetical protein